MALKLSCISEHLNKCLPRNLRAMTSAYSYSGIRSIERSLNVVGPRLWVWVLNVVGKNKKK